MRRLAGDGVLTGRLASKLTDLEMAAMLHGGATLREISGEAGVSRERVRQRLARIGVVPAKRLDITQIVQIVRRDSVGSFGEVARRLGISRIVVRRALIELQLFQQVVRLFRMRRVARRRERLDAVGSALRAYADSLGRTPSAADLRAADRPRDLPCLSTVRSLFGSLGKAQRAVGLEPNKQGRRPRASAPTGSG